MLAVTATPFSVRDILNEDQQFVAMDCYGTTQLNQSENQYQMQQEFCGYTVPESSWDAHKFKEQSVANYQTYSDMSHVHHMSQISASYNIPAVEDGKYFEFSFLYCFDFVISKKLNL